MANFKELDKILKENGEITDLEYSNSRMRNLMLDLLEYKVNNFNYYSSNEYDYLLEIFSYFPYYFERNFQDKKEAYIKIKSIRDKVKTLIIQKPGTISKNSSKFQFLKNLIDNLETFSLSLLYDYIDKYDGSKYEFINYMIFDVKRISLVEDALKRFPYIVNFENKNGEPLIDNVIRKYIDEVKIYTSDKELSKLDGIIYYEEVLKLIINSSKLNFNIVRINEWTNYINELLLKTDYSNFNSLTKQKYVFFLNNLNALIKNSDNNDLDYLKYKYDIKISFNQSINLECNRVLNNTNFNNRKVIKDEVILTFDGKDAKEIDDALSIKILDNGNYLLGIHIADPYFYISNNSIIYDEAKRRTTSIYLSDLVVPMFPSKLSSEVASLNEGFMHPSISYYYEISKSGEVVNSQFYKSYIYIYKNMTYGEFNNILETGCEDINIYETINNLANIKPILSKFYIVDPYYEKLNRQDNNLTDTNIIGDSVSEKLVESAMVFNNHMVASYFNDRKLPFIYRIHAIDKETMDKIEEFSKTITLDDRKSEYLKYINFIKNMYPQAIYSIENKGHYGLGINAYSHVTSPLRRFADILASECLDKMYFNSYSDSDIYEIEDNLKSSIDSINQKRLSLEMFSNIYEKNKNN